MKFGKLIKAFGNSKKILEGIKNNIFKVEHIEAAAEIRWSHCKTCKHLDRKGKSCMAPGTQPCCAQCGCALDWKLRSLSSECPIGRWDPLMKEEEETMFKEKIGYED